MSHTTASPPGRQSGCSKHYHTIIMRSVMHGRGFTLMIGLPRRGPQSSCQWGGIAVAADRARRYLERSGWPEVKPRPVWVGVDELVVVLTYGIQVRPDQSEKLIQELEQAIRRAGE